MVMVCRCFINCFPWCLWSLLAEHWKSACIQYDPKELNLACPRNCRKKKCGHTNQLRPKKKLKWATRWDEVHAPQGPADEWMNSAAKREGKRWEQAAGCKETKETSEMRVVNPLPVSQMLSAGYFWINSTIRRWVKYYLSSGCFVLSACVVPKSFSHKRILQTPHFSKKPFGPKCLRSVPGGIGLWGAFGAAKVEFGPVFGWRKRFTKYPQ